MKFTGKAGALAVATKAAAGALNAKSSIPILHDVLIDAADDLVRWTGTDLNLFVTATCDADVSDCGNAAVPGESLSALLAGLECEADVTIASDDRSVTISAGRARYRLAALPPDTFPHVAEADTTAELALSRDDVQGLFGTTAFCIDRKKNRRLYLQGCYLHADGERLACCATDGYTLALASVPISPAPLPLNGIIVPERTVESILKLKSDVTLRTDGRIAEFQTDRVTVVSKLLDGTFPDHRRIIPVPSGNSVTVERTALRTALARIAAVANGRSTVTIFWAAGDGAIVLKLGAAGEIAEDQIAAVTCGSAQIKLGINLITSVVEAIGAAQLTIDAGAKLGGLIRLTTDNLLAVLAPISGGAA